MSRNDQYLSFPVQLLRKESIKEIASKAINYGIIDYMVRHGLEGVNGFDEACDFIGIIITDANREQAYKATRGVYDTLESSIDKVVYVSIKKDMLFEFRDVPKTDFEIDVFRAFIGVKSIIGSKSVQRLTNEYLVARLSGFSSIEDALSKCTSKFCNYYQNRYQIDKLKKALEENYKMKHYGIHTRGFYISFTMTFKALVKYVETTKQSVKDKAFKDKKKALILEAKQELKDNKITEIEIRPPF
jgi:hypothetical protein